MFGVSVLALLVAALLIVTEGTMLIGVALWLGILIYWWRTFRDEP